MIQKLIPFALTASFVVCSPILHAEAEAETSGQPETPTSVAETPPPLDPEVVKTNASYALGYQTAKRLGDQFGITADDIYATHFIKGFNGALNGDDTAIPKEDLDKAMNALGDSLQMREQEKAKKNLEEGEKFLAENAKREGVTTTASGLQYEIINKGGEEKYVAPKEGEKDNKQFLVNYKGTLINGKQFDASPEGKPVPMTLQVVPGFKEALTIMPVGAKWKLFIPSKLAYGETRRSADIAPNTALIFELELVKIEEGPEMPDMPMPMPVPQGQ
ncbi:MAG: FKBP-type peptidyl-prolyl cis-trans isomerase [Verrucomicrobia bacterium]|nr:MAG: FKBP-type peptidyl-prolyl cis-trans isomerase [Verrucomicrobiota bacterium]